jgi:hypothetical protein
VSPEQRQRPPSYRGGQQGAEEVAEAEAEAAEVAGGGSKGQRKSPEQRQRPPRLREGAARGRGSRRNRGRGRRCCGRGQQGAEEVAGIRIDVRQQADCADHAEAHLRRPHDWEDNSTI